MVASASSMVAISPLDLATKLQALTTVLGCILGIMHLMAGAGLVWDRRDRRAVWDAMCSEELGFQVQPCGAWTWSFEQARTSFRPSEPLVIAARCCCRQSVTVHVARSSSSSFFALGGNQEPAAATVVNSSSFEVWRDRRGLARGGACRFR